jgi:HSP20 family protein
MANLIPGKKRQSTAGPSVEKDWQPLARLRNDLETLRDRYWGPWQRLSEDFLGIGRGLGIDVRDGQDEVVVRADAPGFEAEDFDVQIRGDKLVLVAQRAEESHQEETTAFCHGQLRRVVPLPSGIDPDNVQARYHSGVLEIRIRKGEDAKRKRIVIKSD